MTSRRRLSQAAQKQIHLISSAISHLTLTPHLTLSPELTHPVRLIEQPEPWSSRCPVGVGQDFLQKAAAMQVEPQVRSPRLDDLRWEVLREGARGSYRPGISMRLPQRCLQLFPDAFRCIRRAQVVQLVFADASGVRAHEFDNIGKVPRLSLRVRSDCLQPK